MLCKNFIAALGPIACFSARMFFCHAETLRGAIHDIVVLS
jgi:hypothetical protein